MINVVWFKRDLRVLDHQALLKASDHGRAVLLYILEPSLWHQPDMSAGHYLFLRSCLESLDHTLKAHGHHLIIRVGDVIDIFDDLHRNYGIGSVFSHQETGNGWTYQRDRQVARWLTDHGIIWHEYRQHGIIRGLSSRQGWSTSWYEHMQTPLIGFPSRLVSMKLSCDHLPEPHALGLVLPDPGPRQQGGIARAQHLLNHFLDDRAEYYTKSMSSPNFAYRTCSRLSPYFAFGAMSVRQAYQATVQRQSHRSYDSQAQAARWSSAYRSFSSRLRWHCHFMQKLETQPDIEYQPMHDAYQAIDRQEGGLALQAWQEGQTGYPMIDASMRALRATGWINFRMRAMLMSFSSYHLWLDWRQPALHLARLFTDYEPGIHYSQVQMQSGTTGINAIRIYNPIKQSQDHDPKGRFIRRWISELADMDDDNIHTPWRNPAKLNGYPMPIVDEQTARKKAASIMFSIRGDKERHAQQANKIIAKHTAKRSYQRTSKNKKKISVKDLQMTLPFDHVL